MAGQQLKTKTTAFNLGLLHQYPPGRDVGAGEHVSIRLKENIRWRWGKRGCAPNPALRHPALRLSKSRAPLTNLEARAFRPARVSSAGLRAESLLRFLTI